MLTRYEPYFKEFLNNFTPYKGFWCYEDGVILKGAIDLYEATGDEFYWNFLESYLTDFVDVDGNLKGYKMDEYNIDHLNPGKALFFAYEKTGDERFMKAIEKQMDQVRSHPRIPAGNFWHKNRYPHQVWLDGLYMALPFYAEYENKYNGHKGYADIYQQFINVRNILKDAQTGLYYHAYDDSKSMFWADQETGLSANFWLRAEGWLLMALVDTVDKMNEMIFEHYKGLKDLAKEVITDILPYQDEKTGMFWHVIDQAEREGNYVETSGTAMVAYAVLKGIRLNILDDSLRPLAEKMLTGILDVHGFEADGKFHIGGVVCVAGLGEFGGIRRDGTYEYYISEEVVADEAKAIGPLMSAYAEWLLLNK